MAKNFFLLWFNQEGFQSGPVNPTYERYEYEYFIFFSNFSYIVRTHNLLKNGAELFGVWVLMLIPFPVIYIFYRLVYLRKKR